MQTGTYQRLGTKTLTFLLLKRLLPSIIILIALIILFFVKVLSASYTSTLGPQTINIINQSFTIVMSLGFLLFIIIVAVGGFITWLEYTTYQYLIDEHAFKIKKGIFSVQEISILYRQIQNVDIERPLIYRLFGLSRIVLLTAGHEDTNAPTADESEGIVDAVDSTLAESIQSELLRRSNIEEVVSVPASERA